MAEANDTYLTVGQPSEGLYKEKGSRFISHCIPVRSKEQAMEAVKSLKDRYHDARHHCWAYRLGHDGMESRSNDDGEPSGTAGRPILGVMLSNRLTDVLIVVVRYFGGIKLGTSGLIEAYRTAAQDAVGRGTVIEKVASREIGFTFPYGQIGQVMSRLKKMSVEITSSSMDNVCSMKIAQRLSRYESSVRELSKIDGLKILPEQDNG